MAERAIAERTASTDHHTRNPATRTSPAPSPHPEPRHKPSAKPRRNTASPVATLVFAVAVLITLGYAWSLRLERHITAKVGLGYALGITGGLLLLCLLIYPLRKYWKPLRGLGAVPKWFRLHMIIGILGPTCIILHSNFRLSAINSSIAMFSMLTVVASGLIGRFLYSKVHIGLYGQKAELAAFRHDAESFRQLFGAEIAQAPALSAKLKATEDTLFANATSAVSSLVVLFNLIVARRRQHAELMQEAQNLLAAAALREHWERDVFDWRIDAASDHLASYQSDLIGAAKFKFYERLFSLWHHLHMPLYLLLVITALVHVVTVHLY